MVESNDMTPQWLSVYGLPSADFSSVSLRSFNADFIIRSYVRLLCNMPAETVLG